MEFSDFVGCNKCGKVAVYVLRGCHVLVVWLARWFGWNSGRVMLRSRDRKHWNCWSQALVWKGHYLWIDHYWTVLDAMNGRWVWYLRRDYNLMGNILSLNGKIWQNTALLKRRKNSILLLLIWRSKMLWTSDKPNISMVSEILMRLVSSKHSRILILYEEFIMLIDGL